MSDPTHRLLLELAGRVDDDLLAAGRELVAVGEEGHALQLLVAELAAGRVELPDPVRRGLVTEATARRVQPDADRCLPRAPGHTTPDPEHRFTGHGPGGARIAAAIATVPELLDGALAWRTTPAGSAPGLLPHPVLLARVGDGDSAEVVTYQGQTALARARLVASVEVQDGDDPQTGYHRAAWASSVPVRSFLDDDARHEAGARPTTGVTDPDRARNAGTAVHAPMLDTPALDAPGGSAPAGAVGTGNVPGAPDPPGEPGPPAAPEPPAAEPAASAARPAEPDTGGTRDTGDTVDTRDTGGSGDTGGRDEGGTRAPREHTTSAPLPPPGPMGTNGSVRNGGARPTGSPTSPTGPVTRPGAAPGAGPSAVDGTTPNGTTPPNGVRAPRAATGTSRVGSTAPDARPAGIADAPQPRRAPGEAEPAQVPTPVTVPAARPESGATAPDTREHGPMPAGPRTPGIDPATPAPVGDLPASTGAGPAPGAGTFDGGPTTEPVPSGAERTPVEPTHPPPRPSPPIRALRENYSTSTSSEWFEAAVAPDAPAAPPPEAPRNGSGPLADEETWARDWASGAWTGATPEPDTTTSPEPDIPVLRAPEIPPGTPTGGRHTLAGDGPSSASVPSPGFLADRLNPTEQQLLARLHEELEAREGGADADPGHGTERRPRPGPAA